MAKRIIQPVMASVLSHSLGHDIVLSGRSTELMFEIKQVLAVLEPVEDDECRALWLEIPRGTPEEWKAFDEEDEFCYESPLEEYAVALGNEYPYDTQWISLSISTYREATFLKLTDRSHSYRILSNVSRSNMSESRDMEWFLEPLLEMVKERVALILRDPGGYNEYIERSVPHRLRSGRIRSRDLNRILPERKPRIRGKRHIIEVMRELARREEVYRSFEVGPLSLRVEQLDGPPPEASPKQFSGIAETDRHGPADWEASGVPAPFDTMTIRLFCKYYRIADMAFFNRNRGGRRNKKVEAMDDVEYYTRCGLHGSLEEYDLDSENDFRKFAKDHYGELGLSRNVVGATDWYAGGKWLITFGVSYSAFITQGMKIAMALYETGAPFVFHDASNVLNVLEENGWVRLAPFTFHDYLKGGDDEGVFALPYEQDCDNEEPELTREQLDEIVRLAHWEPQTRMLIDHPVPLDDKVYDLIRNEAPEPLTVSEIRKLVENKTGKYLSVFESDGTGGYRYIYDDQSGHRAPEESRESFPTFNEAMKALICRMGCELRE